MKKNHKKILIIEDDKFISEIYVSQFEKEGYSLVKAENGEDGLRMIESENLDLIILDILLPKMNGFEILEELNKNGTIAEKKIIVLSNLGQEKEIERAKELGAIDYLTKANFSFKEVLEKVEKYI